ncbi:MAG TPA: serine/threonine-protein kinase [Bryobacteraceae bacterium]|nr:serine/threonine-protein kinase [Bryobacteraceae bacterium]
MTDQRWRRIEDVFFAALEEPPVRRAAYLQAACGADHELRSEVESLLAHEAKADAGLRAAVAEAAGKLPTVQSGSEVGTTIGPYQIVREIGRGGMGTVYLAVRVDEQYIQAVAIKLVRKGMDSEFILNRFRHERQILANLNHPNIAGILDGGTTSDGRPYFVMEYIEGKPILEYCEENNLNIRQRLELFCNVCSAVYHAHQKLVIHRDIKPANILVTSEGVPKLLDFGIAKLLVPELFPGGEPATATTFRLMTPDYASPEQVMGDPLTTATDVYSLGATLFELITGVRPWRVQDRQTREIEQAICTADTPKPSSVVKDARKRREIERDLDNIVLMAMRKEPERRYSSVDQFANDIKRYLQDLPVVARKDTLPYRVSKVIRRNRTATVISVVLFITLISGLATTLWQARLAERRFNELRKLSGSFLFEFHDAIQDLPGSTPARALVVRKALEYFDALARDSGNDESLIAELATAYQRVGDVQGSQFQSNLGDTAGAMKSYAKALEMRERLSKSKPGDVERQMSVAESVRSLGDMQWQLGQTTAALVSYDRARSILQPLQEAHPSRRLDHALAEVQHRLGDAEASVNDTTKAISTYQQALATYTSWMKEEPTNKIARRGVSMSLLRMAHMLNRLGRRQEALKHLQQALRIRQALSKEEPTSLTARRDLMTVYNRIGDLLGNPYTENLGDLKGALANYQESLAIARDIAAKDPFNARAFYDLAITYMRVGDLLKDMGSHTERLKMYRAGKEITEASLRSDPKNQEIKYNLALLQHRIALVHRAAGENVLALRALEEAVNTSRDLASLPQANQRYLYEFGSVQGTLGDQKLQMGDMDGARQAYEAHLATIQKVAASDPTVPKHQRDLAEAYLEMAKVEKRSGKCEQARAWLDKAAALQEQLHGSGQARPGGIREVRVLRAESTCETARARQKAR